MQKNKFSSMPVLATHFLAVPLIFLILVLIRYPIFANSDYFFTYDEGLLAGTILNILNGGPVVFYYETARTFGLTFGLVASPFIWFLGPTSLAFNLPATLFYSLYLWTTYLIARILIPRTAYLVFIMLIFTPNYVTNLSTHNWPHIPAAFLGNLIFLLFIKIKLSKNFSSPIFFSLFFIIGLAIYTYTYSLIYILTITTLYALTHPLWNQIREKLSIASVIVIFKNKRKKLDIFCLLLDVLIIIFSLSVVFSYVFGGFGFDIAGHSILQINKFHKAALQLLAIILLRILINPNSAISFLRNAKSYYATNIQQKKQKIIAAGMAGFLIGLSPRFASILIGETSRGGQGHDVDFSMIKLFTHFQNLLTESGPKILGLDLPFQRLNYSSNNIEWLILIVLFIPLITIFLTSVYSFISENRIPLKNIATLRGMPFEAMHVILLLPILVCIANIIVQNGPQPRYLFPLFGITTIWIGFFIDKIKKKYKWLPITVLMIWISFYSFTNYSSFQNMGIIKGNKVVKFDKNIVHDLIDFLDKNKIYVAYSDVYISHVGSYYSGGKINILEFSAKPTFTSLSGSFILKRKREESNAITNFAIIAKNNNAITYQDYLQEKEISYKSLIISDYEIFWDFSGHDIEINNLKTLIS
jgi:hypothetical protein